MNITFSSGKANKCYEEFVNNPLDRKAMRNFCKLYSKDIAEAAIHRHVELEKYPNAGIYNAVYGSTDNRIEKKQGVKNKDSFVLKVRVTGAYRKFFHVLVDMQNMTFLKTSEWEGQFKAVTDIYVIEVNKHDYSI
jgi:hypothetical protein